MKPYITFLFILMFLLGFGQRSQKYYDSLCTIAYKNDSILYLKLKKEAKYVNYKKLTKKIIEDIRWDKLKNPNLIFTVIAKTKPNPLDVHPSGTCDFQHKSDSPNYNDSIFWTKKNINFIVNKYKKNIIPTLNGSFIYDRANLFHIIGFKALINQTLSQKEGSFDFGEKFYYFPYRKDEELVLNKNKKNYNQLQLSFTNELDNKVTIVYTYGLYSNYNNENIKITYQYINREWIELIENDSN